MYNEIPVGSVRLTHDFGGGGRRGGEFSLILTLFL